MSSSVWRIETQSLAPVCNCSVFSVPKNKMHSSTCCMLHATPISASPGFNPSQILGEKNGNGAGLPSVQQNPNWLHMDYPRDLLSHKWSHLWTRPHLLHCVMSALQSIQKIWSNDAFSFSTSWWASEVWSNGQSAAEGQHYRCTAVFLK